MREETEWVEPSLMFSLERISQVASTDLKDIAGN